MPPFTPLKVVKSGRSEIVMKKHHFKQLKMPRFTPLKVMKNCRSEIVWLSIISNKSNWPPIGS